MVSENPVPLEELLAGVNMEEDQYSEDPERRRLCLLRAVQDELSQAIGSTTELLQTLPERYQATFRGEDGGGMVMGFNMARDPDLLPAASPERDNLVALLAMVKNIVAEKGFRSESNIMTYNEHRAIGSTVWIGYGDMDPDVPIAILDNRRAQGQAPEHTPFTMEETDRARRLRNMTTIDPSTGRITDQTDPVAANDSFHYITDSDRRAELVLCEATILQELRRISEWAIAEIQKGKTLLYDFDAYSKGEIESEALRAACDQVNSRVGEKQRIDFSSCQKMLRQLAFETGRYDAYLTPQEILLRLRGVVTENHLSRPYTPLAVQEGTKTIEVVEQWRQTESSMNIGTQIIPEAEGIVFCFRLEELDSTGNTLKTPTFLNRDDPTIESSTDPKFRDYFGPKLQIPFARLGDWFYKPPEGDQ